jgi:hypothetical protein
MPAGALWSAAIFAALDRFSSFSAMEIQAGGTPKRRRKKNHPKRRRSPHCSENFVLPWQQSAHPVPAKRRLALGAALGGRYATLSSACFGVKVTS